MKPRNNIRSFRFSDEVMEVLNGFDGNSLNDKFNNLVLYCFNEVPKREKHLERIEQEIKEKNETSWKLTQKLRDIEYLIKDLENIRYYGSIAVRRASQIAGEDLKKDWDPDEIDVDYLLSEEDTEIM